MSITDPKNTLAFHQSRVLSQHRDMSLVPCKVVAKAMNAYAAAASPKDACPESEALWFYAMNHGVALISARSAPLQPLGKWELKFVDAYYTKLAEKAARAFYYLVRICTRESRHNKSFGSSLPQVKQKYGDNVGCFFESVKGGEGGIAEAFAKNAPGAPIGDYVKAMEWMFNHSSWSGGYGGKKWGAVTNCLVRYVTGEFSAEMMLDTIWTLSHNNGPIFNKSWLYSMYTHDIIRLLDVQRSGQIPAACLFDPKLKKFVETPLFEFMAQLEGEFPNDVKKYVDWEVVEALGSVHKYPAEKQQQAAVHGVSPAAKAAQEAAVAKAKADAEKAKKKAEDHAKNWFQVMPGVEVEKVQIKRAA